jgi:hypothetical protein
MVLGMEGIANFPLETAGIVILVVVLVWIALRVFLASDFEIEVDDPGDLFDPNELRAIVSSDPVDDAMKALKLGNVHWLGFGFPELQVPGVPESLRREAPIRWLPGTGYGLFGKDATNLRENVCKYTLQYNKVLVQNFDKLKNN